MPMFSHILTQEGPYSGGYTRFKAPEGSNLPSWVWILAALFPTWIDEEGFIPEVFELTEEKFLALPKEVRAMLQFLATNALEEDDLYCEDIPHDVWEVLKDRMKERNIHVLQYYNDLSGYGPHLAYHPETEYPMERVGILPDLFLERQHWDNYGVDGRAKTQWNIVWKA